MKMNGFFRLPLSGLAIGVSTLALFLSGPLAAEGDDDASREAVIVRDYQPDDQAPAIVIRSGDNDAVFYEYRVNGELREIRVVPKNAPVYYLVPADGGGWIREEQSRLLIPSWVLFRW